jgi:hypothetical protein
MVPGGVSPIPQPNPALSVPLSTRIKLPANVLRRERNPLAGELIASTKLLETKATMLPFVQCFWGVVRLLGSA